MKLMKSSITRSYGLGLIVVMILIVNNNKDNLFHLVMQEANSSSFKIKRTEVRCCALR